jgi:ferrous iron transport protein A
MVLKMSGGAIPLAELAPGRGGRLEIAAPERISRRLTELGLVPGTHVALVRRGPLGDPVEIELRGYRVCVRRADLEGLEVIPDEAARGGEDAPRAASRRRAKDQE